MIFQCIHIKRKRFGPGWGNRFVKLPSSSAVPTTVTREAVMSHAMTLSSCLISLKASAGAGRGKQKGKVRTDGKQGKSSSKGQGFGAVVKKNVSWSCVEGCGACCKLDKGPNFLTPEEIFEDPYDVELYRSLVGPDGWCINYEKSTRTCSIYPDRPYFCRVEPEVLQKLYGVDRRRFHKQACSYCRDTIEEVYGPGSTELESFNSAIEKNSTCG